METDTKPNNKTCSKCGEIKEERLFKPRSCICKDCRNKGIRDKYNNYKYLIKPKNAIVAIRLKI